MTASATELAGAERRRLVVEDTDGLGKALQHAEEYADNEFSRAASCYLTAARLLADGIGYPYIMETPEQWPFEASWWKPTNEVLTCLVRAVMFTTAEADRLIKVKK